jgi:hypothetical protein
MGKHNLIWSLVQLRLANQHKIIPISLLILIPVNIDQVCSIRDFEVIEIMDDIQPYSSLMGLEWDFENQAIINMKRREIIFEVGDLKFNVPLDMTEGKRYIEPAKGNEIDNLYNMTARMDDYINPIADGALSWRIISSCVLDLEEGLEHWQQRMH